MRKASIATLLLAGAAGVGYLLIPGDACLTYDPPPLFDTSEYDDSPYMERSYGIELMWRGGHRYVVLNIGNEVQFTEFTDPQNPGYSKRSRFHQANGGPVPWNGDRDYNLYNVVVCDDCDYGVAGYQTVGSVIFEIDDLYGRILIRGYTYNGSTNVVGAFTFKHGEQQYLVMNRLPDTCGSATLYAIDGISADNRTVLQCLDRPDGDDMIVSGGFYIPDGGDGDSYVYIVDQQDDVQMYRIDGSGNQLRLESLGAVIEGRVSRGRGIRLDLDAPQPWQRLASAGGSWGIAIWSLADVTAPELITYWDPNPVRVENRTAIEYPYLFAASLGGTGPNATFVYDISDPTVPELVEPDFWTYDDDHPWNRYQWSNNVDGLFTEDAAYLLFSRFSVTQRIRVNHSGSLNEIFADGFESGDVVAW